LPVHVLMADVMVAVLQNVSDVRYLRSRDQMAVHALHAEGAANLCVMAAPLLSIFFQKLSSPASTPPVLSGCSQRGALPEKQRVFASASACMCVLDGTQTDVPARARMSDLLVRMSDLLARMSGLRLLACLTFLLACLTCRGTTASKPTSRRCRSLRS
jgi:hypothetical protein